MADEAPEDFSDLTRAAAHVRSHSAFYRSVLTIADRLDQVQILDQRGKDLDRDLAAKQTELEGERDTLAQIADAVAKAQGAIGDATAKADRIVKDAKTQAAGIVEQGRKDAVTAATDVKKQLEGEVKEINGRAGIARTTLADLNNKIEGATKKLSDTEAATTDVEARAKQARDYLAGLAAHE